MTFTVVAGEACQPSRSDEFNGALNTALWNYRHSTTPATGAKAPTVSGGNLVLPLGSFSVDLARTGPIGYLGQPLPTGDFTVVAKLSAPGLNSDVGGVGSAYAQAGLKIYQGDNNWIKVAHNRNADGNPTGSAQTYFELANETTARARSAPARAWRHRNLPTWWMRVVRTGATITASYSLTDPDGAGGATWVGLGTANVDTVMPAASGPRYIGVYGGNGSVNVLADYVRFTPDSPNDAAAPVSSHTLAAADGSAGWHRTPVNVTLRPPTTASASRASTRPSTASAAARSRPTRRRSRSRPTARTRSSTAPPTRRATRRRRSPSRSSWTPRRR